MPSLIELVRRSVIVLALGALSTSALAQEPADDVDTTKSFSEMSSQELFQVFHTNRNRWQSEPCEFGVPLLSAMETHNPGSDPIVEVHMFAQLLCHDERGHWKMAAQVLRELEERFPNAKMTGIGLYLASRMEDGAYALNRLQKLEPEQASELDDEGILRVFGVVHRDGATAQLEDLTLEWSESGMLDAFPARLHSVISLNALGAAARQKRHDQVENLLSYINSPSVYVDLIVERKYAIFWPQIEQRAGPNLSTVGDESVAQALGRLDNDPSDRDRFSDAAHALHFDGRFAEAIDLAQQWRLREERGKEIEEGDGWALNIQAYAYDSLGQPDQADAIFDSLAALDPEQHDWAVNFVINRASRLVGQGRWEKGLEASRRAKEVSEDYGTPYAEMINAKDHACALWQLGRAEEAAEDLDYLRENVNYSLELTAQGLMCHGHRQEAAKLLIDGLRDPATRDRAVGSFRTGELDLFYTASMLPVANDLLSDFPELANELDKHVRPIPEAYIPRAALKRKALDLPNWD